MLSFIKKIDKRFFNSYLKKKYFDFKYGNEVKKKINSLNFTFEHKEKKILLLTDLLKASPKEGVIVECGVGHGFSLSILSNISKKRIYAFDSFEGFPEKLSDKEDKNLSKALKYSKWHYKLMNIDLVKKNLLNNGITEIDFNERIIFKKGFFPKSFEGFDEAISFLHLDVDLYESYKDCLEFFYPKVLKGGIVTFDEYTLDNTLKEKKGWDFRGAKIAIDEFLAKNNIKLNNHFTGFKYIVKV